MRTLMVRMLAAGCLFGLLLTAHAQTGQSPSADIVSSNAPAQDQIAPTAEAPATGSEQNEAVEPEPHLRRNRQQTFLCLLPMVEKAKRNSI